MKDIFKHIDEKPIGTASLAQCHRAILHDGTVVAVKIQHPSVKKNLNVDIQTISVLYHFILLKILHFYYIFLNSFWQIV